MQQALGSQRPDVMIITPDFYIFLLFLLGAVCGGGGPSHHYSHHLGRSSMKNVFSLFRKPKPMEKPMSAEILGPSVNRAIGAYKRLEAAHAAAAAKILEMDKKISDDANIIAGYKALLDEVFPEDVGGSLGGITE